MLLAGANRAVGLCAFEHVPLMLVAGFSSSVGSPLVSPMHPYPVGAAKAEQLGGGGPGGGGAASFKNVIAGTSVTVDASSQSAVNTGDTHYSSSGSGAGGACHTTGTRGRVVLIFGGEATTFDSAGSEATFVVQ
eukprot:COSAG03_NODE_2276_length_2924_cov_1.838938_5_plen_134_part_00